MSKELRVLIVEDSEADALLLLREIRKGGFDAKFERADSPDGMSAALERQDWDIVICDYLMPGFSGPAALKLMQEKGIDLPFIVVSGKIGEDDAVELMKAGAHDYIVKGDLARLIPAVERELREVQVRRARTEADEALRKAYAELEIRVKERTVELAKANEDLRTEIDVRKRSEEVYRTILRTALDGFWLVDLQGRLLDVNEAYCRMIGYSRDELLKMRIQDVEALETPEETARHIQRVVETGSDRFETRQRRKDGAIVDVEVSVNYLAGDRGRFFVFLRDITERKRAEQDRERLLEEMKQLNGRLVIASLEKVEQAEEAERRAAELDATFMAMADAVVISDAESRIARANPAAERMLGFTPEDYQLPLAERTVLVRAETTDGKAFPLEDMPTWRALRYGESNYGVIMVLHSVRTGKSVWVSNSSSPIRSADGRIIGAVTVFADITYLHEQQALQEDLLRTVSHDLRNPLQVILGQSQIIQRFADKPDIVRKSADGIIAGGRRTNTMIQDLVDAARFEAGQLRPEQRPVSLKTFLDDLLNRNRGVLTVSRIKVKIPADLPPVSADPDRLERILINLLTNALKYSGPETDVEVAAKQIDHEAEVSVTDHGVGVAPEDVPHIFERFYRVKGGRKAEGVGLGLYIARMLVEAHGGRIWVESELGKGSPFTSRCHLRSLRQRLILPFFHRTTSSSEMFCQKGWKE